MKARARHTASAKADGPAGWVDDYASRGTRGQKDGDSPLGASRAGLASWARLVCKGLALLTCVLVVAAVGLALEIQSKVSDHASARSNPINTFIAEHILPRANQMAGLWRAGA